LLLLVAPLPAYSAACLWRAEPAVTVFITDPEARPQAPAERLAELFGLTPAEARRGAGCRRQLGPRCRQISAGKRCAHLRALMGKTKTNRKAALVR
jgi:hypothetical protein